MFEPLPARELPPAIYHGVIEHAAVVTFDRRREPANPLGLVLHVWVSLEVDGEPADVADFVAVHFAPRLCDIFQAAGLPKPERDIQTESRQLIGLPVAVETMNVTPKQGRNAGQSRAVIYRWHAPRSVRTHVEVS